MDLHLRKLWAAATASLVACTAVVSADYSQQQNQNNQPAQPGQMNNQQPMVRNAEGPDTMITPSANIANRFFVTGEALFWWAREGGLEYAVVDRAYNDEDSILNDGQFLNPDTRWNTGFRIGLGYVFKHDNWDLNASWTYFQSRSDSHSTESDHQVLPLWSNVPTNGANLTAESADAKWKVRLNIVDLEMGRAFMTSKWLVVTIRGFFIEISLLRGASTWHARARPRGA